MKTICKICKGKVELDKRGVHWLHTQPYSSLWHEAEAIALEDNDPEQSEQDEITLKVSQRELFTILAALRLWQETANREEEKEIHWIATEGDTVKALNDDEIDELCDRINWKEDVEP